MNLGILLGQMFVLFAMMLVGYFVWKKEWLNDGSYRHFSKIIVNIFNPLLIINGVIGNNSFHNRELLVQNIGMCMFFFVFLIVLGWILVRVIRPSKEDSNLYRVMTFFPNVGFMGIPVITSLYGKESMIYIVFYIIISNVLLYTYGYWLIKKSSPMGAGFRLKEQFKQVLNPGVVACILAMILFCAQIQVVAPIASFCNYMGNATIPLSMMMIGMSIARADLKQIITNKKAYEFLGIRIVLIPILLVLLLKNLPINPMILGVFAMELAMPVGSIVALIAKENGVDETCCTNSIVMSTLLSLFTIPIVYACLR